MSDDTTPRPETEQAAPQAAPEPSPAADRRLSNQTWLLIVGAALLLGCLVGAGTMAVGTFVAGHLFHDRERAYVDHDRRDDHRRQPPPIRKQPAPPKLPKLPPSAVPTPSQ
ncbi:MAG TPA: hypothetical protein VFC19_00590 [Candidatus Limnocylindrales bacterium]|nr:hypothetical protein [Candidatus Limnocylindrales bacterium]